MNVLQLVEKCFQKWMQVALLVLLAIAIFFPNPVNAMNGTFPAVVFDIDGTLTPDCINLFDIREYAVDAVNLWLDKGYKVITVTARPQDFISFTDFYLNLIGIPTDRLTSSVYAPICYTVNEERRAFKRDQILEQAERFDLNFIYAYGDSATDFQSYDDVGILKENTFALLRWGCTECEPGNYADCFSSYEDHLNFISAQPNV